MPEDEVYLRPHEVAAIFSVSVKTVARWSKEGRLPYITTLGGHRRFPADPIRKLSMQFNEWSGVKWAEDGS
jgi:excisionase family DNA binding protein